MLLCNEFTDVRTNSGALLQKQFLVNTFCIESWIIILVISKKQTKVKCYFINLFSFAIILHLLLFCFIVL